MTCRRGALALVAGRLRACSAAGQAAGDSADPDARSRRRRLPSSRSANAGQAVTIETPVIAKELRDVRVPVQVGPTDVAYVKDLQWVDTPDRLFQDLLAETVLRTTNRVVLDRQADRRSTRA